MRITTATTTTTTRTRLPEKSSFSIEEQSPSKDRGKTACADYDNDREEGDYVNALAAAAADDDDDNEDDNEDIQRDIANQIIMCIVHVALAFFALLFLLVIIIAIVVASRYGLVTFAVLAVLLCLTTFIGCFVYKTLNEDEVVRPLQRKIRQWNKIATEALVEEVRNIRLDVNENLLLGDGSGVSHEEGGGGGLADDDVNDTQRAEFEGNSHKQGKRKQRRGARSAIFGFVFKYFLKKKDSKKRFKFGSKKKSNINVNDCGGLAMNSAIV